MNTDILFTFHSLILPTWQAGYLCSTEMILLTFLSWRLSLSEPSGQDFKAGLLKLFPEQELRVTAGERNGRQLGMDEGCGGATVSNFL